LTIVLVADFPSQGDAAKTGIVAQTHLQTKVAAVILMEALVSHMAVRATEVSLVEQMPSIKVMDRQEFMLIVAFHILETTREGMARKTCGCLSVVEDVKESRFS